MNKYLTQTLTTMRIWLPSLSHLETKHEMEAIQLKVSGVTLSDQHQTHIFKHYYRDKCNLCPVTQLLSQFKLKKLSKSCGRFIWSIKVCVSGGVVVEDKYLACRNNIDFVILPLTCPEK